MTVESVETEGGLRTWIRWSGAAAIVLVVHAAGAWMLSQQEQEASDGEAASAVLIELAPLPMLPADDSAEVEPTPEVDKTPLDPVMETAEAPDEPDPPTEPEIDLPPPPEPAEPTFDEAKLAEPIPPPAPRPEVVLPEPPPARQPVAKPPEPKVKKEPPQRQRQVEQDTARERKKPQSRVAPPRSQAVAAQAAAATARGSATASSASPVNWRGLLLAHLRRSQRYPPEARQRRIEGTVHLNFSIDRNGRVMSYRIVGSSGSEVLDHEALAMIQRASPLPAPPSEVAGARINFTVPVRFDIR
jgi:protein TonB